MAWHNHFFRSLLSLLARQASETPSNLLPIEAPIKCGAYRTPRTQTANTKRPADSRRRACAQIY